MGKLTALSKILLAFIALGATLAAIRTYGGRFARKGEVAAAISPSALSAQQNQRPAAAPSASVPSLQNLDSRPLRVAIATWPGHMPLVLGNGGLTTHAGSAAANEGINIEISMIDDPATKNEGLQTGKLDFVWQTVDELPINLGSYQQSKLDLRVFLQLDWSRGGDACVAAPDIHTAEDILGHTSAMMMFSPDHTLFEFMITNSNLTPSQIAEVRRNTQFSLDDITFGRSMFTQGKAQVACLWEPDVSLALAARPGAHRLFSTAQATELIADILVTRKQLLDERPDVAEKLSRVWFAGVEKGDADRPAAARAILEAAPRFADELGFERTLSSLDWVRWSTLADNVRFFGLDGAPPAFDRAYNQADSIWINYPEAAIGSRFVPATLRDDQIVRKIWNDGGRPVTARHEDYDPAVASRGAAIFTKPISINFASGSSLLDTSAIATINREIVPQAEMAGGMSLRVEGNTDNVGDAAMNQALSERRAHSIVDFLVLRGITRNRLLARGNGTRNPATTNRTPEGRAQNRRTDVLFIARP
jgi:outer membrane protein OmpA-like peptidoglycan-associated protein/ABC-type nitrate/sulfonate/bicarbonate transport system substrate-binding protein